MDEKYNLDYDVKCGPYSLTKFLPSVMLLLI